MKPVLSVVIPTRDRRILVRKAIEYFERMDPVIDAELIIIDNGVWPLVEDDVHGHQLIRGMIGETIGPQLNLGIAAARGDFILRQDDDDWYAPNWYTSALTAAKNSISGISGVTDFYAYNPFIGEACQWDSWGNDPKASHWSGGSMCFRRDICEKVKFNNLKVGSDREFLLNAYKQNPTPRAIVPNGTKKYVMIRHTKNLTGEYTKPSRPDHLLAVKSIIGKDMEWYMDLGDMFGHGTRVSLSRDIIPLGHFEVRI
jgi:glycosyltransferase involved in cell wall biosynthesis